MTDIVMHQIMSTSILEKLNYHYKNKNYYEIEEIVTDELQSVNDKNYKLLLLLYKANALFNSGKISEAYNEFMLIKKNSPFYQPSFGPPHIDICLAESASKLNDEKLSSHHYNNYIDSFGVPINETYGHIVLLNISHNAYKLKYFFDTAYYICHFFDHITKYHSNESFWLRYKHQYSDKFLKDPNGSNYGLSNFGEKVYIKAYSSFLMLNKLICEIYIDDNHIPNLEERVNKRILAETFCNVFIDIEESNNKYTYKFKPKYYELFKPPINANGKLVYFDNITKTVDKVDHITFAWKNGDPLKAIENNVIKKMREFL